LVIDVVAVVSPPAAILYQPADVILFVAADDWGRGVQPEIVPQSPPEVVDARPTTKMSKLPAVAPEDKVAVASPDASVPCAD